MRFYDQITILIKESSLEWLNLSKDIKTPKFLVWILVGSITIVKCGATWVASMRRFLGIFALWNTRHYADSRVMVYFQAFYVCVCVYIFLTKKAEIENKASPLPFFDHCRKYVQKIPTQSQFSQTTFHCFWQFSHKALRITKCFICNV